MKLRKITKREVRAAAETMAECFRDYPIYHAFFPNDKMKERQIFYFFWFRLYARLRYTYVTENGEAIISVMRPGDREHSTLGLILNPRFFFGFLFHIRLSVLRKVNDFSAFEESHRKNFYDPEKDVYIKAVCVRKDCRSTGIFFDLLRQLDDGSPIYAETHSPINARLYRMSGAEILLHTEWSGIDQFFLKRPQTTADSAPAPAFAWASAVSR
ncbi:MAG: hypothetical protein MJ082_00705 [Clostridia bacterium]|nr:hypothetical protein [Clostridia bacterium]